MADLSTSSRKQLAYKWAVKHGLDLALVCCVIHQESAWDTFAFRYEAKFYDHYIQPLVLAKVVTSPSEAIARATSYGLMQVMGQVAREMGFSARYLTSLCDPDSGIDIGCQKLKQCVLANPGDVNGALLRYNGGSNALYPSQVLSRMPIYQ